ncbi:MAG: hypothetical protein AB8F74_02705 [Saprospiraceae bacterium]
MENILDEIEKDNRSKTNFKKWSFRLFVYAIIANCLVFYKIVNFASGFHSEEILDRDLMILSIVITVCLILGLIFIVLSYKNKEEKNYQYKFSIIGIPMLIVITILANLVGS